MCFDMQLFHIQVDEDEPLFLSLISDLFPGIQLDSGSYAQLQEALRHAVEDLKLINHPSWNLKVVQVCNFILVCILWDIHL